MTRATKRLRASTRLSAILAGALLCLGAPRAVAETPEAHEGALSTTPQRRGEKSSPPITASEFRRLLDDSVPPENAESTLVVLTQCYSGDTAEAFRNRGRTAVLAGNRPGEKTWSRGYVSGIVKWLKPNGSDVANVHFNASQIAGRVGEEPVAIGPLADVTLEPAANGGAVESRHVLVYAGQVNGRGEDPSAEFARKIAANFRGKKNTTVTTVGGTGRKERPAAFDYPGSLEGLRDALKSIGPKMNDREQLIVVVADHGELAQVAPCPEPVAPQQSVPLTLLVPDDWATHMLASADNDEGCGVALRLSGSHVPEPGDVTLVVDGLTATAGFSSSARDLDGDGDTLDPDEGIRLFFPVDEGHLLAGVPNREPIDLVVTNNSSVTLAIESARLESGPIAMQTDSDLALSLVASGSSRYPGDSRLPVVFATRPDSSGSTTDDRITLTLVVDSAASLPVTVNARIVADLSAFDETRGERELTAYFRHVGTGAPVRNPMTFGPGRTVLRLELSSPALLRKLARSVSQSGPVNLPLLVAVDDPAVDSDPLEFEGTNNVTAAFDIVGLRPSSGTADDGSAEFYAVVGPVNMAGDFLAVRFDPIDMPRTDYTITGVQVVAGEFGGPGSAGIDAVEVRLPDPVFPDRPDPSAAGLITGFGTRDGVGDVRAGAPPTSIVADTPDRIVTASAAEDPFICAWLAPGDTILGSITAIGVDETLDTALERSSFRDGEFSTPRQSERENFMMRILINGEKGTRGDSGSATIEALDPDLHPTLKTLIR